jgi:hypothetical protein
MNSVQIEQKSYEMPPPAGISIALFLNVADTPDKPTVTLSVPNPDHIEVGQSTTIAYG